jgi:hypothetical protein
MNEIIRPNAGEIVAATTDTVDSFQLVFSPAKPTLDWLRKLQPCLKWLDAHRDRLGSPLISELNDSKEHCAKHRDEARWRYDLIPDPYNLWLAQDRFHAAERESAAVDWLQAAVNLMLAGFPNARNVSEHYAAGIVDAIMDDPEVWQGYDPGFSCPVVVRAIREIKRGSKFVPTHAEFLELCQNHRQQFWRLRWDMDNLRSLRGNAERILINLGEIEDVPWGDDESWGEDDDQHHGDDGRDAGEPF